MSSADAPQSPRVSVILPVYNRSDVLATSCRTVLDQSFRDLELIVVDDASTEDLRPVIEELDDPRVHYIRQEKNAGAAAARNAGLAVARGALIAFQDSDDIWLPGKLAHQVALLEAQPEKVGAVAGGKIAYNAPGSGLVHYAPDPATPLRPEHDQVRRTLQANRISLQNALFRRTCYPDAAWFDPAAKANNDWEFIIRMVQHSSFLEEINPVTMTFLSTDSISTNTRKKLTGLIRILRKNRHLAKRYPKDYGRQFYPLGRGLMKIGKRKTGLKFMVKGIRECPSLLLYLGGRLLSGKIRARRPGEYMPHG